MRFYRLHRRTGGGISGSFQFYTRRADAERDGRAWAKQEFEGWEVDVVDVTPTKAGILRALEKYASHADNG
jgi:hypothetical protein